MNPRLLVLLNTIALVAVLVVNYLSNSLPLNGKTPGQLSDEFVNLFVPAGSTFAIWGVIYSWLIVFGLVQIVALFSNNLFQKTNAVIQKTGFLFVATCVLNIAWIFAWHWHYLVVSVVVMIILFVTLWVLNSRIVATSTPISNPEKWLAHAPFGIYLGWISIALIANVTAVLVGNQWSGWNIDQQTWTMAMIIIGGLLACLVILSRNYVFYGLAVVWALYGIYLKRQAIGGEVSEMISTTALFMLGFVVMAILLRIRNWIAY
jgi:hypothetical protein